MFGLKAVLTIGVALAFPFGSTVQAQDYARSGAYVGVGAAIAFEAFEDELEDEVQAVFGPGVNVDVDRA